MPLRPRFAALLLAPLLGACAGSEPASSPPPTARSSPTSSPAAGRPTPSSSLAASSPSLPPPPDGVPWLEEVAKARGLVFRHVSGHDRRYFIPEVMGGGGALFDMDGDGDLDAYLIQGGSVQAKKAARPPNRLFRNLGDGRFEDVTEGSGAAGKGYGMGVACGDYDGDGDVDLYVTNYGPNLLLRNDGGGRFTDVTAAAGVGHPGFGASAAFLDHDRDGDLDLFLVNYLEWSPATEKDCLNSLQEADYCHPDVYRAPGSPVLYRNEGNGRFTDVSQASGVASGRGTGLGVVPGDFDGDGWPDLYVANDNMRNQLWINRKDGRFVDQAVPTLSAVDGDGRTKSGMGVAAADVDDDRDLDILVVNLERETDTLLRNDGPYFTDVTDAAGLGEASLPFTRFGVGLADLDNDGFLDLYLANGRVMRLRKLWSDDPYAEPNLLFRGGPGGTFTEVSPQGGTAIPLVASSRAAAFGDVDGDGGVDILAVNRDGDAHLLRNVVPNRGHWASFRVLERSGRDALGATVTLSVAGRAVSRDVNPAGSYLASSDPRVHVGLGAATETGPVTVRWVGGESESFPSSPADRVVTLRRGEGRATQP